MNARNSILLWLAVGALFLSCSRASAQQYRGPVTQESTGSAALSEPQGPRLTGPRIEVAAGILVMGASFPVAFFLLFSKDPGFQEEYEELPEQQQDRELKVARRAAILGGLPVGLLGVALIAHGAFRIKRAKSAYQLAPLRPSAWNVEPTRQRTTVTLAWSF